MLQTAYNNRQQASYTRMEEPLSGGRAGMGHGPPPAPPPPPPLASGRLTPVLKPGCRPPTSPGHTIHSYSTADQSYGAKSPVDYASAQHGTDGLRQTPDDQQIRRHPAHLSHGGVVRPVVSSLKWAGTERQEPRTLEHYPTRVEVPAPTVDTDLALSLVNETRPSYEMKTAGKKPLSEQHLLSLVDPALLAQQSSLSPSYANSYGGYGGGRDPRPVSSASPYHSPSAESGQPILHQAIFRKEQEIISSSRSPVPLNASYGYKPAVSSGQPLLQQAISHRETQAPNKPLHSPLLIDTQYGRGSRSPGYGSSVSPQEFDPSGLCRELRQTQLEGRGGSKSPKKPSASYSPRQLSAYRSAPAPLNLRGPSSGEDVDTLTSRMMYNMETGSGAAGDYNCAKCGEGISSERPGCTALNQTFHLDCFVCTGCGNRLAGGSFYAIDGKPYCETDYIATLDKCTVCSKAIMDRILRASGKAFHPGCFVCTACGKCLDGVPFTIDSNNQVHCVQCFHDKYAPRCAACGGAIVPEEGKEDSLRIVAMDKSFHVHCYKCEDCGMKLSSKIEGHGCYPLDDHLLCKSCNAERVRKLTANA